MQRRYFGSIQTVHKLTWPQQIRDLHENSWCGLIEYTMNISRNSEIKFLEENWAIQINHGKIRTRDDEMRTDPGPRRRSDLYYNVSADPRSSVRKYWPILFKSGTNIIFCNNLDKYIGQNNSFNIYPP